VLKKEKEKKETITCIYSLRDVPKHYNIKSNTRKTQHPLPPPSHPHTLNIKGKQKRKRKVTHT